MAKRFTDTCKWDKAWFRKLTPIQKCIWLFLCDKCDHAGVWDIDQDAFEYFIGEKYSFDSLLKVFGDKVQQFGDKLVIPSFVEFQYSTLKPENRVHKSVLERLAKVKNKPLGSPFEGAKDTDTETETDTDTETDRSKKAIRARFGDIPLFELWNANCSPFAKVLKMTEKRKRLAASQWVKYMDHNHWLEVLFRWKQSEFCLNTWRPGFDDWLNESKRISTLEGKYDNRDGPGQETFAAGGGEILDV